MYRFRCPNVPLAPSNSPKGESLNRMKKGKAAPSNSPKGESLNRMKKGKAAPSSSPKGESLNRMKKGKAFLLPLTSHPLPLNCIIVRIPLSSPCWNSPPWGSWRGL